MSARPASSLAAALAFCHLLAAQSAPSQREPLLRLVSTENAVLDAAETVLAPTPRTWQLAAGQQGELTWLADGALQQSTAPTALPPGTVLHLTVRPRAWLRVDGRRAALEQAWGARVTGAVTLLGIDPKLARTLLPGLLEVLGDLDACSLTTTRAPNGLPSVRIALTAAAGTPLHAWLELAKPGKRGVVALPAERPTLHAAFDLAEGALAALGAPLAPWLAQITLGSADADVAAYRQTLTQLDGSGACVISEGCLQLVLGLRDADGYAAAAFAPALLEQQRAHLRKRRIDLEHAIDAAGHRGIRVLTSTATPDQPVPLLADRDGDVIGCLAVAGAHALSVAGGTHGRQVLDALIDRALDGGTTRNPMPASEDAARAPALATLALRLDALDAQLPASLRERLHAQAPPAQLQVAVHRLGDALVLMLSLR